VEEKKCSSFQEQRCTALQLIEKVKVEFEIWEIARAERRGMSRE
jgi:hypothetical protein